MSTIDDFRTGKLTPIYTPLGKDDRGRQRYVRERYDQLEWSSASGQRTAVYAVPLGIEVISNNPNTQVIDPDIGREFGFYGLDKIIADRHLHDGSDGFIGLQFFGPV